MKMSFTVYILECRDGTLYAGYTTDIQKRLHQHNNLKTGARYTSGRRPVKLVHKETFKTLRKAKQREYRIKQLPRAKKLQLINA
jgi:putative endonuclease